MNFCEGNLNTTVKPVQPQRLESKEDFTELNKIVF